MMVAVAASEPATDPGLEVDPPESVSEAVDIVIETIQGMVTSFFANVPFLLVAGVIILIGFVLSRYAVRAFDRGMGRTQADVMLTRLGMRVIRASVIVLFILIALSVAGISVGAAVTALGIAGLAVAFALQSILENFIAGVLLLIRKPFNIGDQIKSNDLEGTVEDINLRVTILTDYDNEQLLIPNADVLNSTLVNLTTRGNRRSRIQVGVDYRDDHNAVNDILEAAVGACEGVLPTPPPRSNCVELGDSAVVFEVMYWTAPQISEIVSVRDRVLRASKDALEDAGMSIPWPIRTLAVDPESADVLTRR